MIEARCSLRLTPETCQRFLRIGVIRQDSFQSDDAARMPLSRPINYPHPAAPDFFQNLIIAYAPFGIAYIEFSEHVIKRFRFRWIYGGRVTVLPIGVDSCGKKAAKTKTSSDPRCRSAFGASSRLLLEVHRDRTGGIAHEEVRMVD
jgi:hypothetical protein